MLLTKPLALRRLKRVLEQVSRSAAQTGIGGPDARQGDHSYWLRLGQE